MRASLPYGSWPSPLSAADAAAAAPRFEGAAFVGDEIWWGESVAAEGGRTAILRRTGTGETATVLPAPFSARSRVHEYGGGSWAATADGTLFFVEKSDQRVWRLAPGAAPAPLTPEADSTRFGGLTVQAGRLLAIREVHDDRPVPARSIVAIDVDSGHVEVLVEGSDFLAQPALSPDGSHLAWVAWDHPDMPWDRTVVRVGRLGASGVDSVQDITSGATSALQPTWTDDGELLWIDDRTGRWNLYRGDLAGLSAGTPADALAPADADTGGALWTLGSRWYGLCGASGAFAVRTDGDDELVLIAPTGATTVVPVPPRSRLLVEASRADAVLVSGTAPGVTGIWLVGVDGAVELVRGATFPLDADWLPEPRRLTVEGPHGPVHAFDYPPTNPEVTGPTGERPPYLVWVHGGPTSHVAGVADTKTAFFTSRGIGVLDVNYGGSTGYGREYRERLRGQWGVVDVDDVAAAARGLVAAGAADGDRLAIEGGSAGGWTVLGALVGTDVFAAGVSRYGVADARTLAADTHDFEARYLDGLIGPLPEAEELYIARSPLQHADRLRVPLLILQGDEDAVVPPSQSEAVRDALAARGVPHAYVLYEGEGHGFRRTETIVHALESELAFLGSVFGFATPGVPPLPLAGGGETIGDAGQPAATA